MFYCFRHGFTPTATILPFLYKNKLVYSRIFYTVKQNSKAGGFFLIFCMYVLYSTLFHLTPSKYAGIEPRTVAALAVSRSNHSAGSHSHSARSHPPACRSHPHSARFHSHSARSYPHSARSHPHSARSHPQLGKVSSTTRQDLIHIRLDLHSAVKLCTWVKIHSTAIYDIYICHCKS